MDVIIVGGSAGPQYWDLCCQEDVPSHLVMVGAEWEKEAIYGIHKIDNQL